MHSRMHGRTDGRTHALTAGQPKNIMPLTHLSVVGRGIKNAVLRLDLKLSKADKGSKARTV